jgi:hypothetical protein
MHRNSMSWDLQLGFNSAFESLEGPLQHPVCWLRRYALPAPSTVGTQTVWHEQLSAALKLSSFLLKVACAHLGHDMSYPNWDVSWYSSAAPRREYRHQSTTASCQMPSNSPLNKIPTVDSIQPAIETASLNEQHRQETEQKFEFNPLKT